MLDQIQFLVNNADPGILRITRAGKLNRPVPQKQFAIKITDDTGQDLHERTLARSVFTHHGMQFAKRDIKTDIVQSAHRPELLAHVTDGDDGFHGYVSERISDSGLLTL